METILAVLTGVMVAGSIYLLLGRNLVRFIFGLVLASNAVNLLLFAAGRPDSSKPPLIPEGLAVPLTGHANSLPQALILTAIVIGFALLAFVFILFYRAYERLGTVETEDMNVSEAQNADQSPTEEAPS